MKDNTKHLLTLPNSFEATDIALEDLSFDKKNNNVKLYFKQFDELLEYLDAYSDNENIEDKASTLLRAIFTIFKVDYISSMNWKLFKKLLNINAPKLVSSSSVDSTDSKQALTYSDLVNNNSLDKNKVDSLSNAIEDNRIILSDSYHCENTRELLIATLNNIFENKNSAVIKRCENCNMLYIPKQINSKYCNRISPQFENKTCKQAMDIKKKKEALTDPIKLAYKKIYSNLYNLYSKNRTKENRTTLQSFKKEHLAMARKYRDHLITEAEFLKWYKSFYKRNRSDNE